MIASGYLNKMLAGEKLAQVKETARSLDHFMNKFQQR